MKKIILAIIILGTAWVNLKSYAQTTVQFINNSPDTTLKNVDIYLDTVKISLKIVTKLSFTKATNVINVSAGWHNILLTKNGDTAIVNSFSDSFPSGANQMNIIYGVINPLKYASNPDGVNTSLSIATINNFSNPSPSTTAVMFFNGSTDAPTYDVNKISSSGQKIANDYRFADLNTASVTSMTGKNLITVTNKDSNVFYYTYNLDVTSNTGRAAILFASGVNTTNSANPVGAASFALNIAFSNGTVKQLNPVWGKFQVIHNSADSTYDTLDVYYNNTLYRLGFRTATPMVKIPAYTPLKLAIATKHSASNATAFNTNNFILDSSTGYVNVMIGQGADQSLAHITNPEGVSTAFAVKQYKGIRDTSMYFSNVDLLYFHGATDLMKTSMLGYNGVMFISKNDVYSTFHNQISYNPAIDNLEFDLNNAYTDTTLIQKVVGNISKRSKQVGIIFSSGYYDNLLKSFNTNDTIKLTPAQQNRILGLFIAWADGKIDTIQTLKLNIGVRENSFINQSFSFYPNPVSDKLHISLDLKTTSIAKIELSDISGKVMIQTEKINMGNGIQQIVLDTRDLMEGIYFCSVIINDQKMVRKICVMK